jgi:hypothetical protein
MDREYRIFIPLQSADPIGGFITSYVDAEPVDQDTMMVTARNKGEIDRYLYHDLGWSRDDVDLAMDRIEVVQRSIF